MHFYIDSIGFALKKKLLKQIPANSELTHGENKKKHLQQML
jgi:hypothetical protein